MSEFKEGFKIDFWVSSTFAKEMFANMLRRIYFGSIMAYFTQFSIDRKQKNKCQNAAMSYTGKKYWRLIGHAIVV